MTGLPPAAHHHVAAQYPAWVKNNRPRPSDMRRMRNEASGFGRRPVISVVIPVYDPEPDWLEKALDSVVNQIYPEWELCVCDDGSPREDVREVLARYERLDERIKVIFHERNTGIVGASNTALSLASGEFAALLDHDDELSADALFEVAKSLQKYPDTDLIYSDVDKIDEAGNRSGPHFKPGWSPDLLLCQNFISHLGVYRRSILDEIGGFREGFDGAQDYDLVLRFTEKTNNVRHIPKILYHWRTVAHSFASDSSNKSDIIVSSTRRALSEAMTRRGLRGAVEDGLLPNRYRVKLDVEGEPMVSVVIPTRDNVSLLENCVESVERTTDYANYEILIVDNGSADPETVEYLSVVPHRVIGFDEEFNYSRINNFGVSHASGEYVLFLNDDVEAVEGGWMEEMLRHAGRPEVGAVGVKLLYPNGRVQHAGVVVGAGNHWTPGVATHSHQHFPADSPGYAGTIKTTRNYSAVTAACMMVRKSLFTDLGGFDEENLPIAYNDVDLCLRMRERGYSIVYTPHAELLHHESASRGFGGGPEQFLYMRRKWGETLDNDPYYNPNFSRGAANFNLRADLLRPRALRPDPGEPLESPLEMEEAERAKYMHAQRVNARSSPRTTLIPKPASPPEK